MSSSEDGEEVLSDSADEVIEENHLSSEEDEQEDVGSDKKEEESDEDEEESDDEEEVEGAELGFDSTSDGPQPVQIESVNKTWKELGLSRWLVDQLKELQLKKPTPVQAHCIPKILDGSDVLGCARTGTGKTMAFALPILQELSLDPYGVFALVLTPTRELASQIHEQFLAVGKPIGLKCVNIIGGVDQISQGSILSRKPHVVVATPGRLADYIETHTDTFGQIFKKIRYFVLDEADRMLDGQYAENLKTIFGSLPKKRQTLLFSATITSAINQLHQVSVRKPYFFEDKSEGNEMTVERLEQKYVLCPSSVKDAYLVYIVKNYCERNPKSSVIIFSYTCRECQALAIMFNKLGFQVGSLHSQVSQKDRTSSITRFRDRTLRVLVCTDVAARGLDIPHVDLVVNHNIPDCPKTYIHRVGRSARAGRYGSALTMVSQYDVGLLKAIEATTGKKMEEQKVSDKMVTRYVTQVLVTKRESELLLEEQKFGEKKDIYKRKELVMGGMDPEEADKVIEKMKTRRTQQGKTRTDKMQEKVDKRKKTEEEVVTKRKAEKMKSALAKKRKMEI